MQDEPYPLSTEPNTLTSEQPDGDLTTDTTLLIHVTQQDPELRTIEAMLELLQLLPIDTRVRALRYVQDRIESDPAAPNLKLPDVSKATPYDVAQALAESDGHDWATMTPTDQSPYYRRADALSEPSFVVIRQAP